MRVPRFKLQARMLGIFFGADKIREALSEVEVLYIEKDPGFFAALRITQENTLTLRARSLSRSTLTYQPRCGWPPLP